jgi:hypothetical protein
LIARTCQPPVANLAGRRLPTIHADKMMKRLSLTILCCFLLSGCIFDPVFDASNWDAFQRSSAAIKAKLGNDDLRRLDIALKYLLMEGTPRNEINGQLISNVVARANTVNPLLVLARLKPRIDGKSAATVIQNLSVKLDAEISETAGRLNNVENLLGSVEVDSASFYWKRSGRLEQPVIEFTVRNMGKFPISRIYFSSVLTTPNRSVPWVSQEFVQTFKGGLEVREKQQLTLPRFGEWSDPQLKNLPNAELKVVVTNFENANGERMIAFDSDSLELKRKVRAALQ